MYPNWRAELLDDDALATLVADMRASVVRATSAALDEIETVLPEPIVSACPVSH